MTPREEIARYIYQSSTLQDWVSVDAEFRELYLGIADGVLNIIAEAEGGE